MLPDIAAGAGGGFRLTGRHVLYAMLGFFGIVIAVNLAFVHLALSSWTGLTDHDSYRTGLSWNRTLERDAAQRSLGWTVGIETRVARSGTDTDRRLDLTLTLRDRSGVPLTGLALSGEAVHPVLEANDRGLDFAATDDGRYAATVVLPAAGDWGLKLVATRPDGTAYRIDSVATVR